MNEATLTDIQVSVQDKNAFTRLADYERLGRAFLEFVARTQPVRIISPSQHNYFFYQYGETEGYKIGRPLNNRLFIENANDFAVSFDRFMTFLDDLRRQQAQIIDGVGVRAYIASNDLHRVVYTSQQAIGCVGDSFANPNQSRKRVGQLFETLVKLILLELGLECEQRTINLPIPGHLGYHMPYELDLVFSRGRAIVTAETKQIQPGEIVGSVKTTSKDRIDKVFLDKYLLTKLVGRDVPVVAIFLHDVQRAVRGNSIFGVNSTFKSNHFLGYSVALNRLDGVYYVDPRPEMLSNRRLSEQISDFQQFLIHDLWQLSS